MTAGEPPRLIAEGTMLGRNSAVGKCRRAPENDRGSCLPRGVSAAGAARHRAEILVQPAQQIDQHLALVLAQTRQQPPLALERRNDHLVMGGAAPCRQRDRMGPAVVWVGADRDLSALLQARKRPTYRALV